jgi:hypothetical protein
MPKSCFVLDGLAQGAEGLFQRYLSHHSTACVTTILIQRFPSSLKRAKRGLGWRDAFIDGQRHQILEQLTRTGEVRKKMARLRSTDRSAAPRRNCLATEFRLSGTPHVCVPAALDWHCGSRGRHCLSVTTHWSLSLPLHGVRQQYYSSLRAAASDHVHGATVA